MLRYTLPFLFSVLHINLFFFFYLGCGDTVPTGIANSNVRIVFYTDDE